jgi:hypothetical protein
MGPTIGDINGVDHHANAKALFTDFPKMTNEHNMHVVHHGAAVFVASLCVYSTLASHSASTNAQVPARDPNKIVAPVLVPNYQQNKPIKDESASKETTYLVIGRDAVIGIVSPNQIPPDSSSVLALVANGNNSTIATKSPVLVLVDGQRIPGTLESRQGVATWISAWCAPWPVVTDEIRSVIFDQSIPPQASDTDVVQLKNGDRVTGFVTTITPEKITVDTNSGTNAVVSIDIDTIAAISLVGPDKPPIGARVWLSDGTVIDGLSVSWFGADYLQMPGVAGAKTNIVTVPRDRVLAFRSGPDTAIPLATLSPTAAVPSGTEGMRFSTRPPVVAPGTWPLDAPPLEVEGPVLLSYPAPPVASRLVTAVYRPFTARTTGMVDVVIRSGGKEIMRERFDSKRPRVEIRVDLPAAPFDLELQPADGSAVGDMVVFERALLFPKN